MTTIPTAERIAAAAVTHFSSHGYDASSLARIAEAVGIRKASLYSHFSCKDELFMRVFSEALEAECRFACDCFAAEPVAALPGSSYCASLVERFEQSEQLQFLLRTGYMPPLALEPQISAGHEAYLAQLQSDFAERLGAWGRGRLTPADIELYGEVYLGLVDSVQVKLVYTDASQAQLRLQALQQVLQDALLQRFGREDAGHE